MTVYDIEINVYKLKMVDKQSEQGLEPLVYLPKKHVN